MSAITAKIFVELWLGNGDKFTIDDVLDFFKKDEHQKAKRAIKELKQQEFIKDKQNYDGSVLISLSERGKLRALNYVFRRFEDKKEEWDGKWRMVSFDIPEQCVKGRKALVYRLKSGGFYELQDSLFLHPYNCEKEVRALISLFKIEKYVRIGMLDSIDGQDVLIQHFKLEPK